jgi:glycolate oxidase FAD binding subunit
MLNPATAEELAEALGSASSRGHAVTLGGNSSKQRMAGPVEPGGLAITTTGLRRVLQYEPGDLTISVEAGLPWGELTRVLAANRQMVPLDPPFADFATVGGVVAANSSGPRRRLYGTARDMIIGMKFATMEGKLVQSGGMVVKNVAGLDMAKLMTGSFGTLAAIAVINFKVVPSPERERSFLVGFDTPAAAKEACGALSKSVLQPAATDLLNPPAAGELGLAGYVLAVQAGGNPAVIGRYESEMAALGGTPVEDGAALWRSIQEFTPRYLGAHPEGTVVRVSCALREVTCVLESAQGPAFARAGSGVCYAYFPAPEPASGWAAEAVRRGWKTVIEFAPEARKASLDLWPAPGDDFEIMRKVKRMFDPQGLLNRGRLYGRI